MNFKDHYAYRQRLGRHHRPRHRESRLAAGGHLSSPPHFENEDVDLCGNTLIVVNDREARDLGSLMYVISIANPAAPAVSAILPLGLAAAVAAPGHIANFVKADCTQVWVDGGDLVEVVDLSVPDAPRSLGKFESAASLSHFVQGQPRHGARQHRHGLVGRRRRRCGLQADGQSAGAAAARDDRRGGQQSLSVQRLHPPQLTAARQDAADHGGGLHRHRRGSARRLPWPGEVRDLGSRGLKQGAITPLDTWETELNGMFTSGAVDSKAPVTVNCSSHWFDAKDGVAAVGWYEQGVRFLDYRTPSDIVQVGYYIPANGSTWAAYWSPTDPTGQIVYTADAYRGVDVLRIDGGGLTGKKVKAPVRDEWFGSAAFDAASFQSHPGLRLHVPGAQGRRRRAVVGQASATSGGGLAARFDLGTALRSSGASPRTAAVGRPRPRSRAPARASWRPG